MVADEMGLKVKIVTVEERLRPPRSEVQRLVADISLAKQLLGWEPEYAGMEGFRRGMRKTIAWFQRSENFAHYKPHLYSI
jgi:dTDP-glucose 4,6-dehydratase